MALPAMVELEPSYAASMAIYLTTDLYGVSPSVPDKSWIELLNVQDEPRFYGKGA